ncbi:nitrate reductase [Mangrovimicrobium sediminis]|uniref:Nitrate reductase n=1 Tax=Mangrovimicrobium sediminis TaxID=2562682 RepID=A0A4Z0M134_9GAMM|nr:nitrate reductase [Haliea sp. SAOS-164]TGD73005.1 nitrate reductase [Haliea sp. SAOS-164]
MPNCNTTCPYCGVGCGVTAQLAGGQVSGVLGDGDHPANAGRLCVKGTALAETLGDEGRLLHPVLAGHRVSWQAAIAALGSKLQEARERHGPDAIAFYLSGQLLTEDYYVANKLMKGFLGSGNVDTNSRLCMSSAVAAHKRAFGEDVVPCTYADVEDCDLLVMVGSNAAWTHPVVYQRIEAAKQANPGKRIVVIDPRRTASCDLADLHLQLLPGTDAFLFAGLLRHLANNGALDRAFIDAHTSGLDAALDAAGNLDAAGVAQVTGLDAQEVATFYDWFTATERTVSMFSQGVKQSATGTDKCNAVINCHLATGRIGRPGMGPFSITGQPNAMGGREVGGLSNQLAAHMDYDPADVDRVARFWGATDMAAGPGLKAVDLFQAAADGHIKFLWIMATNPAVSLPDSALVRRALARCEFVVVSDCTAQTDTAAFADLLLPAAPWGEKDGTVTNSERVISRQRQLVPALGEARPDWLIVTQVARALGLGEHFDYRGPEAIFREHAALSAFENNGSRAFDIGALAQLDDAQYAALAPVRWPLPASGPAIEPFCDGRFFTADGRARIVAVQPQAPAPGEGMTINTGRFRDQWHTMTRTGRVPRLSQHRDFFSISLNPSDAAQLGLAEGDLVEVGNAQGVVRGLATLDPGIARGQSFVPIHWSGQFTAAGGASNLIPAITDPYSGQPQSKFAHASIAPCAVASWGLLFSREPLVMELAYWSRIAVSGGYLTLLADTAAPATVYAQLARELGADCERAGYEDSVGGDWREVGRRGDTLHYALFLNRSRDALPERGWMTGLGSETPAAGEWHQLLAGFSAERESAGKLVCSCWEVGETQIARAIEAGADSVETLGAALRCGTQCGSCIPELRQLLDQAREDCAA